MPQIARGFLEGEKRGSEQMILQYFGEDIGFRAVDTAC